MQRPVGRGHASPRTVQSLLVPGVKPAWVGIDKGKMPEAPLRKELCRHTPNPYIVRHDARYLHAKSVVPHQHKRNAKGLHPAQAMFGQTDRGDDAIWRDIRGQFISVLSAQNQPAVRARGIEHPK